MNICACKTKSSKESMRQNSQQHDTGRCCHHVVYICSCPTGARRCCCGNIFYSGSSAIGAHRCCCKYDFALAALPLLLVQSATQIITHVHCPPAPRPPKHIPCLGAGGARWRSASVLQRAVSARPPERTRGVRNRGAPLLNQGNALSYSSMTQTLPGPIQMVTIHSQQQPRIVNRYYENWEESQKWPKKFKKHD